MPLECKIMNIVALTETWLWSKDSDIPVIRTLTLPGYRFNHHHRGGGVGMLHKENIKATAIKSFNDGIFCLKQCAKN